MYVCLKFFTFGLNTTKTKTYQVMMFINNKLRYQYCNGHKYQSTNYVLENKVHLSKISEIITKYENIVGPSIDLRLQMYLSYSYIFNKDEDREQNDINSNADCSYY